MKKKIFNWIYLITGVLLTLFAVVMTTLLMLNVLPADFNDWTVGWCVCGAGLTGLDTIGVGMNRLKEKKDVQEEV